MLGPGVWILFWIFVPVPSPQYSLFSRTLPGVVLMDFSPVTVFYT